VKNVKNGASRFLRAFLLRHGVDFNVPSLDLLGSVKRAHDRENHCTKHGHAAFTTSTGDELFSRINIDDFEKPLTSKIKSF